MSCFVSSTTPSPVGTAPGSGYDADIEGYVVPKDIFAPSVMPVSFTPRAMWPDSPSLVAPAFREPTFDGHRPDEVALDNTQVRTPYLAPLQAMVVLPSESLYTTTYIWSSGKAMYMTSTMRVDPALFPTFDEEALSLAVEHRRL